MKIDRIMTSFLIFCFLALTAFAAEIPPTFVKWPAGAEALIDKAIGIKVEAQRQNERMFSEAGTSGDGFVKCLEDLARILGDHPQMRDELIEKEGVDLKAKIALWSLDRKARPDQYAKLEHLHMSDNPVGKAVAEREQAARREARRAAAAEGKGPKLPDQIGVRQLPDGRPPMKFRPKVVFPTGVSDDDRVESNRWILEFLYFAPPTGNRELEMGSTRYVLIVALKDIGNEKSLVMLKFDNEVQIEAFPDATKKAEPHTEIGYHAIQILDFRSPRAFSIVASMIHHPGVRDNVGHFVDYFLSIHPEETLNPWYHKLAEYRKLANMEWHTDAEKELASLLRPLPDFPPPNNR